MPHKHKRKRGDEAADFDLPPTQRARPLPAVPVSSGKLNKSNKSNKPNNSKKGTAAPEPQPSKKRDKGRSKNDDVPRGFRRLMAVAQGRRVRSGLDDGKASKAEAIETTAEAPRIRPGEDMRSFAARVDAALPVSGLTKKTAIKDGKDEVGLKVRRTKKERKMHKLYDQWRAEDVKIKEKREEEQELAAEAELDDNPSGATSSAYKPDADEAPAQKKSRRRRRNGEDEDDPWLELKRQRGEAKVGLHDVAKAPPELHKKTTRQLKVAGAAVDVANVPKASGSLRRREELQVTRNEVVEAYRKIREHEQAKLNAKK